MTIIEAVSFFSITFVAAAINSVAGGGTFLTFPIFIMNGLTPLSANIMSTVALWPGTVSSSYGYRKEFTLKRKYLIPLVIVCALGGAAGAMTLLNTSEVVFRKLVPWLLLFATMIFTFGRYAIVRLHKRFPKAKDYDALWIFLHLPIAFYGGYFGAGIGIVMLAILQLAGRTNIHQMNAIKTLLAAVIGFSTLVVFSFSSAIIWDMAAVMTVGGIAGGYFGARFALKVSPEHIRKLVSAIGFSMTMYFFVKS